MNIDDVEALSYFRECVIDDALIYLDPNSQSDYVLQQLGYVCNTGDGLDVNFN